MEKEMFEKMYPTNGDKVGLLLNALQSLAFFVGAMRSAKKGDFDKATFKAVVWGVSSHNLNQNYNQRYQRVKDEPFLSAFGKNENLTSRSRR